MNESRLLADIRNQEQSLTRVLSHQLGSGRPALIQSAQYLQNARKIVITGIGASLHAAYPLQYELVANGFDCRIFESGELLHYQERSCTDATVIVVSRSGESVEIVKLLSRLKQIAAYVVGVTNESESTLAKDSDVAITVGSLSDEIIAVQSYTGTVAAIILLSAAAANQLDQRHAELTALLPQLSSLVAATLERIHDWDDFFKPGSPTYLLGRGPSYASALEGSLLFSETAKEPAVGLPAGSFRHGPVEIVDANFRSVVFAPRGKTRELNLALARDLVRFGAKVRVVGPIGDDTKQLPTIDVPNVPERIAPLLNIIPVQLAALRLAYVKGLAIGKFRYAPQVTVDEMSF